MAELRKVTPEKPSDWKVEGKKAYYPSFSLELKDIPEAKKWDVPSTHRFEIEVEMTSVREDERKSSAGFDIKKVGVIKRNLKKELAKIAKEGNE